jgi:UDP-N-acetylglucosamine:LPS N-acetylglucosamine transferase
LSSPPEVLVFTIDAGGGHRAAARALAAAAEEVRAPWRFRVLNLQSLLLPFDPLRRLGGLSLEEGYNLLLRRRWTAFMVPMLRVLHALIALRGKTLSATLARHLAEWRPAAVVSVMPNFNRVIRDALRVAHPGVPFLILLTDFADFPPHFWMEPGVDRVIVGSEHAVSQALERGIPRDRISLITGMVLHPRFHQAGGGEVRARVRSELGLGGDAFAVLLLFGGKGSAEMEPLADRLLKESPSFTVIAICGDNPSLLERLAALESRAGGRLPRLGFTDRVSDYMAASDVLVTKPGPGSLAEAFHRGVPVVVTANRRTIPQERFNTRFVTERQLGLVVRHWREIPRAVASLAAEPERLARLRANIAALPENKAVYEALEVIGREIGLQVLG